MGGGGTGNEWGERGEKGRGTGREGRGTGREGAGNRGRGGRLGGRGGGVIINYVSALIQLFMDFKGYCELFTAFTCIYY